MVKMRSLLRINVGFQETPLFTYTELEQEIFAAISSDIVGMRDEKHKDSINLRHNEKHVYSTFYEVIFDFLHPTFRQNSE